MKVLVDTCIWSHTLRHKTPNLQIANKLKSIIENGQVVIIGPIRQEILSGISKDNQFELIREHLSSFEDVQLHSLHFIKAAEFSNICLKKGIQGSTTDFLICAVAYLENCNIFSVDLDFSHYKKHLPIHLLSDQ